MRIVVTTKPVDLCKESFTGTKFVFRAKRTYRLKLLYWDGTGLVMAYKRLEDTPSPGLLSKMVR